MLPMPLPPTAAARMFSFRPTTLRQQRLGGIKKIDPMRHFSKKVLQSTWRCNFPSFYYDRSINRPTNQPTNRWTGRVIWKTIHLIRCFSLCSVLYIYVYIYIQIYTHKLLAYMLEHTYTHTIYICEYVIEQGRSTKVKTEGVVLRKDLFFEK